MASPNLKKRVLDLLSAGRATTGFDGIPDLATDADLVDAIFTNADYSAPELLKLQTWFGENSIAVIGEYPRSPEHLPAVVIQRIRDGEKPGGGIMGDASGPDYSTDTETEIVQVRGVRATEQIHIQAWALHSTAMRDAIYLAVRELLLRGRGYLEASSSQGIDMVTFTSGKDNQMDIGQQQPMIVYLGELTLTAETRTTWRETVTKTQSFTGKSTYNQWHDER